MVAPVAVGEERDGDRCRERDWSDPAGAKKGEAESYAAGSAGLQRAPQNLRQAGERGGNRGERGELGQRLVRVHHQAKRAEQEQHRRGRGDGRASRLRPAAAGEVGEIKRRGDERAARQPRRGVKFEQPAEQAAECRGDPVVERRIHQPAQAGDARHQQVAAACHAMDDGQRDDVLRLPGIVAGKAGKQEYRREKRERLRQQGKLQAGQHAPGFRLSSWCSGA